MFVTWAGAAIAAHTLVLMRFAGACLSVWKQPRAGKKYIEIARRALMGAVAYAGVGAALGLPLLCSAIFVSISPERFSYLSWALGLDERVALATFGLPLVVRALEWAFLGGPLVVLATFFLLGLLTMLPATGRGSKVTWGAVGLAANAAYLTITIAAPAPEDTRGWSVALIAAGISAACLITWLWLKIRHLLYPL
jgi:hypothetical protein